MATTSAQDLRITAHNEGVSKVVEGRFSGEHLEALDILGTESVDKMEIEIHAVGDDDFVTRVDTRRAPGAPFKEVGLTRSFRKFDFGHFGLEAVRSREQMIAETMRPAAAFTAVHYQSLVRQIMKLDQELGRVELLTNPSTWATAGHAVDVGATFAWDHASGDLFGNIKAGKELLRADTSIGERAYTLWMPHQALQAALEDTDYKAALAATASTLSLQDPGIESLAVYLGVDIQTDSESSLEFVDDANPTRTNAWGDVAILYIDHRKMSASGNPISVLKRLGRVFQHKRFAAQQTIFDWTRNVWRWRREEAERSWVLNDEFGVLFHDVSDAV